MENEFDKRVEEFRFHYFNMYGAKLDDEILYVFVRMNEMHVDLKKQIKNIPKISFNSRWDYFMYGLGRLTIISMCTGLVLVVVLALNLERKNKSSIETKKGIPFLKIEENDSTYYLPLRRNF